MLRVDVAGSTDSLYEALLTRSLSRRLDLQLGRLRGLRVLHVNSTAHGGGVAEILHSLVPLADRMGIHAEWWVIDPDEEFFVVTKKLHNALQGRPVTISDKELMLYVEHNRAMAHKLASHKPAPDVVILHDPQVLPLAHWLPSSVPKVWRCHIDASTPFQRIAERLEDFADGYSRWVVSMSDFALPWMDSMKTTVIHPAIDPFADKNRPLTKWEARSLTQSLGIDTSRPLVTQVSRFDPWKDPCGVIDAYRITKRYFPQLQLALMGAMTATDDPEGLEVLEQVREYSAGDPDIHVIPEPERASDLTVNAVQRMSNAVLQKSIREGFGLTVSEAMWKAKPVIGGNCGGIRIQIEHGKSGYLVNSPEGCARYMRQVLSQPLEARHMGLRARRRVKEQFLLPRMLIDELAVVDEVLGHEDTEEGPTAPVKSGRMVSSV